MGRKTKAYKLGEGFKHYYSINGSVAVQVLHGMIEVGKRVEQVALDPLA